MREKVLERRSKEERLKGDMRGKGFKRNYEGRVEGIFWWGKGGGVEKETDG
jgi:hypothetical protein